MTDANIGNSIGIIKRLTLEDMLPIVSLMKTALDKKVLEECLIIMM